MLSALRSFKKLNTILSVLLLTSNSLSAQNKKWSLKECIDYAFKSNVALNQQRVITNISNVNYQQAKANMLPSLNFNDAQNFSYGNSVNSFNNQTVRQSVVSNTSSLSSSVPIFNGFKYANLVKENRLNYEAATLDVEKQQNDLALNVTAAYIQALFQYDAITIAQNQVEADSVQVDKVEQYVKAGQLAEGNLLQIKAQLATDRAVKVSDENQLQLAGVQLMQLMEIPITDDFEIERPESIEPSTEVTILPAQIYGVAEHSFPEVKSAALRTKAAQTDLLVNKAAFMPSLTLGASIGSAYYSTLSKVSYQTVYQDETIGYLQSNPSEKIVGTVPVTVTNTHNYPFFDQLKDNFSQLIALNLSVPIFNSFRARYNVRIAKYNIDNAQLNEQNVKNQLRKSVEQAYTDKLAAAKNLVATDEQLNSEARAYSDMKQKFETGLSSATDYLVEKSNYYKAELANLQAKYEYMYKSKVVDFYLGTPLTQ